MNFNIVETIDIISRTPHILNTLLKELPRDWTENNEGGESWSPKEIVAHLLFGERTDWISRVRLILKESDNNKFDAFNMVGHKDLLLSHSLDELLNLFSLEREEGMEELRRLNVQNYQLDLIGIHAEFGAVTLKNHLAAWVAHDLGHIAQISRVMAKQYRDEVGPWTKYMSVLNDRMQG